MIARGLRFVLVIALTGATSAGQLPSTPGTPDDTPGTGVIVGQVIGISRLAQAGKLRRPDLRHITAGR